MRPPGDHSCHPEQQIPDVNRALASPKLLRSDHLITERPPTALHRSALSHAFAKFGPICEVWSLRNLRQQNKTPCRLGQRSRSTSLDSISLRSLRIISRPTTSLSRLLVPRRAYYTATYLRLSRQRISRSLSPAGRTNHDAAQTAASSHECDMKADRQGPQARGLSISPYQV